MVAELAEKDQETRALKADFFTQQEALVRETNLLKNKLQSVTGRGGHCGVDVNQTSAEHPLSRPPHASASAGAGGLKDILHKEALLQDQHEQVLRMGE